MRERRPKEDKDKIQLKQASGVTTEEQNHPMSGKYNNKCLIHQNANKPHLTRNCHAFKGKSPEERGKIVKDTGGCKLCLSKSHPNAPCPFESKWGPCKVDGCQEFHSKLVHGCGVPGISMHTYSYKSISHTLLLIQDVRTPTGNVKVFWDNGSSLALVSQNFVTRNRLTGVAVTYELITVGNQVTLHHTKIYEVMLMDRNGDKHKIVAYEIEEICGKIGKIKVGHLVQSFPSLKHEDVKRHSGEIDLLIGFDHAALHPQRIDVHEGLCLYKSQFGTGKILGGTHQLIKGEAPEFIAAVSCHVQARLGKVYVNQHYACGSAMTKIDFFSSEEFGVNIPPRCNRCKSCKECCFETQQMSRIEQEELAVIKNNMKLDPVKKRWTTTYPYKTDPKFLEDNYQQALSFLERTEKRLARDSVAAEKYAEQIQDLIDREVIVEITKAEMKQYDGPVFYLTHHEVKKL